MFARVSIYEMFSIIILTTIILITHSPSLNNHHIKVLYSQMGRSLYLCVSRSTRLRKKILDNIKYYINGSQPWVILPPSGTFSNICRHFWFFKTRYVYYWHQVGKQPRMLLNVCQWTDQPLITKTYLVQNISSSVRFEKSCPRDIY